MTGVLDVGIPEDNLSARGKFSNPTQRKYHYDGVSLRETLTQQLRQIQGRNEFLEGDLTSTKKLLSELVQDMIDTNSAVLSIS